MSTTQPLSQNGAADDHRRGPRHRLTRVRAPMRVDRLLLRAFLRAAGDPPVRCVLPGRRRRRTSARASPVGTLRFLRPPRALRVPAHAGDRLRRGLHGRPHRGRGRSARRWSTPRIARRRHPLVERLFFPARRPRANSLRGSRAQHPPPLRPRQRLLPPVARRAHALHLRLLPDARGDARGGAGREDAPRLPQGRAAPRRAGRRSGLRLGLAGAAHGAPLRRHRPRLQHLARADRLRPRAGGARRA